MYRKRRKRQSLELNVDSLMDILTCSVGVMLFVVIFAVIEARGVNIRLLMPMLRETPKGRMSRLFVCQNKELKFLDINRMIDKLLGTKRMTYHNIPQIVEEANEMNLSDEFFSYSLDYETQSNWWNYSSRSVYVIINNNKGVSGITVEELEKPNSRFQNLIKTWNKDSVWFSFVVDVKSLDLFRKARQVVLDQEFSTGWQPVELTFPRTECIIGCGGRSRGFNPLREQNW